MDELAGKVMGNNRYRLERQIAAGGQGLLYLGWHIGLHRSVAIRILPRLCAQNPVLRGRFEREAQRLAQLRELWHAVSG